MIFPARAGARSVPRAKPPRGPATRAPARHAPCAAARQTAAQQRQKGPCGVCRRVVRPVPVRGRVLPLRQGKAERRQRRINELVPPELQEEQMNILVLGLDYDNEQNANEAELGVVRSKENPMADMLLYVQYNKKTRQVRMLQVPRDMFVVTDESWHGYTMGTGKINACLPTARTRTRCRTLWTCSTAS